MAEPRIALQLYTVRDVLKEDYVGGLKQVKSIGYDAVELSGQMPYEDARMKEILDEIGLQVIGFHVPLDDLEGNLERWVELSSVFGTDNIICPYLPEERRKTKEGWLATASLLDEIGSRCRERGKRLSYHNHSFEFVRLDGQRALDLLYEKTSPQNLYAEIDTYWVKHGGEEPADYVRKYGARIVILHVKDMAEDQERSFTEIGSGILDWPAIHRASLGAGVQWYCVEQDICKMPSMESARRSLEYVSKLVGG